MEEEQRVVSGARKEEDAFDSTLRPLQLEEFIGQEQVRANLRVFI